MKKLLGIVVLTLSFLGSAYSEMSYEVEKDEFTEKTYHYIISNFSKPNKPLKFPYRDSESSLIVVCLDGSHHNAYVYFTEVNLTGGKIYDGYKVHKLKIKTGKKIENIWASQDFGNKSLNFNVTISDKKKIINLMKMNDEIMIQFNHYPDGKRFYKYDTKGFSKLFNQHC